MDLSFILYLIAAVCIALGIAVISLDPPRVLFAIFCIYGLSGYGVYAYRKMKGRPVMRLSYPSNPGWTRFWESWRMSSRKASMARRPCWSSAVWRLARISSGSCKTPVGEVNQP